MASRRRRRRRRTAPWVESGTELERTVYFSDAVFAIAITLLILDIKLPNVSEEQLRTDLPILVLGLLPQFISFVITFLMIGFYWLTHHRMFRYIDRYDGRLLWTNIVFLMSVAFLPFPTSVLSEASTSLNFDRSSSSTTVLLFPAASGGQQFAVAFYAASAAVSGLLLVWLWRYAARGGRLVNKDLSPRLSAFFFLWTLLPPLIFILSIGISFASVYAAQFSWLLIPVVRPLLDRILQPSANDYAP